MLQAFQPSGMPPASCDHNATEVPNDEEIEQCNVIENINFGVIPMQQNNMT